MDGQFQESECIRAYTASELMEEIIVDKYDVIYITKNDQTKIHIEYSNYSREDVFPYHIESETLADAL
jgi:vacuolar-type H+-ATPase subunit F/Vma7